MVSLVLLVKMAALVELVWPAPQATMALLDFLVATAWKVKLEKMVVLA